MEENEGKNSKFNFDIDMALVEFDDRVATRGGDDKLGSNVQPIVTEVVDGKVMANVLNAAAVQYPLKGEGKGKEAEEKGTEKTEES